MIESLQDALRLSPDNVPLRLLLAEQYYQQNKYEDAESHFKIAIEKDSNSITAKKGLSKVYLSLGKLSPAIVILEELATSESDVEVWILLAKALLKNEEHTKAIEAYKNALSLNPNYKDNELDSLRHTQQAANSPIDEENVIEASFQEIEKPKINFDDVGGMQRVKEEINIKVIQPLQFPELYKAYGKTIGGGILLYGPPGCGKTHLARATAGQIKAGFISIGIHDVMDMWLGNSEKRLHELFELARRQAPTVLFFDEIDALGANRSDMKGSSAKMVINQFLNEMDGVQSSNEGILILGATNAPWHLDSAFRRPGRFDRIIFVQPPDNESRENILKVLLRGKPAKEMDLKRLAKITEEFSGADLKAVLDLAIEKKLRESFKDGIPKLLEENDLAKAVKEVKPSTKEWFVAARNYALYANESGLYDEILTYLKIKK